MIIALARTEQIAVPRSILAKADINPVCRWGPCGQKVAETELECGSSHSTTTFPPTAYLWKTEESEEAARCLAVWGRSLGVAEQVGGGWNMKGRSLDLLLQKRDTTGQALKK